MAKGYFRTDKMTPKQREAALKAYQSGKSIGDVARKYGVSTQFIWSLANPRPKKIKVLDK